MGAVGNSSRLSRYVVSIKHGIPANKFVTAVL